MSAPLHTPEGAGRGELCVFLACGSFVCAIATRWVDRLVLASEASGLGGAPIDAKEPLAGHRVVVIDGQPFAAYDLALLLDLTPAASAFVLLRVPARGGELPLAIRTGACLFVEPLAEPTPLPHGIFRSRRGAIGSAFTLSAAARAKSGGAAIGLTLDPLHLLGPAEIDRALASLASAGAWEAAS